MLFMFWNRKQKIESCDAVDPVDGVNVSDPKCVWDTVKLN